MTDHEVLLVLGPMVLLLAIACEVAWRNRYVPQWLARKVLHLSAVGACAAAPLLLDDLSMLIYIVIFSELLLIHLVTSGRLFNNKDGGRSWGIMLFPLPYLFLLFAEQDRWAIALPMAILAFADAFAAIGGQLTMGRQFALTGDPKSLNGSIIFFLCTLLLLVLFPNVQVLLAELPGLQQWFLLISIALLLTAVEALGSRGWDNVFIPLATWSLLVELEALPVIFRSELALQLGAAVVVSLLFIPIMVRMKWLSLGGAIAAAFIGLWVLFFAGIIWLVPLFLFLATSTVIGRIARRAGAKDSDAKHGRARDAVQVLCNGGVFALAAAFFDHPLASVAMAVSIAISAADTWASEIGIAFGGTPRDILRWRKVPAGLSGGVSLSGTAGALAASFLFAMLGAVLIGINEFFWPIVGVITMGGMLGMLLDSMLGASMQARYRNAHGDFSDSPTNGALRIGGRPWMSNDLVNLLSNLIITGLMILVLEILYLARHSLAAGL